MSQGFSTPQPYQPPPNLKKPYAPPPPNGSNSAKVVLIVLAVIGILVLLACGGVVAVGYYAYQNAKQIGADFSRKVIVDVVEQSQLQDQDKRVVIAQVDRVVNAYKEGRIALDDVGRVMQQLAESPLFPVAMVKAAQSQYLVPSGLSDEEKEQARLTLERVARGVYEKSIAPEELDPALDHISQRDAQGNRQFKQQVSDAELRQFLAQCDEIADQAQIPEMRFEIDIGQEFKNAVDRALSGK